MHEGCACGSLSNAQLIKGLNAIDEILVKAKVLPEWRRLVLVEERFRKEVERAWSKRAERAVKQATQRIRASKGKVTAKDLSAALKMVESAFANLGEELFDSTRETLREGFRLGISAMNKKIKGKYRGTLRYDFVPVSKAPTTTTPGLGFDFASFDVADEEAVRALAEKHTFWIGRHYKRNIAAAVRRIARTAIRETGGDPKRAGEQLARLLRREFDYDPRDPFTGPYAEIPTGWRGSTREYFEMVAANAMTTARVAGQLTAMQSVGATRYTVVNPLDERTCTECRYMSGHAINMPVDQAYDHLQQEIGASPTAVRERLHPWGTVGDYRRAAERPGRWSQATAGKMIDAGYGFPPYHGRCRCTVDISDTSAFL
jgi:hypothetical protein